MIENHEEFTPAEKRKTFLDEIREQRKLLREGGAPKSEAPRREDTELEQKFVEAWEAVANPPEPVVDESPEENNGEVETNE